MRDYLAVSPLNEVNNKACVVKKSIVGIVQVNQRKNVRSKGHTENDKIW